MTVETKKVCISDRIWNYIQAGINSGLFRPEITEKERMAINEVYRLIRGSEVLNGLNPQVVATFVLWYGCQIACSNARYRYNPGQSFAYEKSMEDADPYRSVADVNFAMHRKPKKTISREVKQRLQKEFENEFNDMITRYQSVLSHYVWMADHGRIGYLTSEGQIHR